MRPLQEQAEPIYVVPDTDTGQHVRQRFPHKQVRHVGSAIKLSSIEAFRCAELSQSTV